MTVTRGTGRPGAYRLANGDRVPSVTTICSRFKESGGLIHWAWQQGADGKDYRDSKKDAGTAGSIAHGWIEAWVHGEDPLAIFDETHPTPAEAQAVQAYNAFLVWAEQVKLRILETEVPLVSERYKFGGTLDANALIAGVPMLLDWKSSNGTYPEYVVQLAAYRELLRERDDKPLMPAKSPLSAQLLRVGKDHGDFHLHFYPESVLDIGWRWFERARAMYEDDKTLKKVCS